MVLEKLVSAVLLEKQLCEDCANKCIQDGDFTSSVLILDQMKEDMYHVVDAQFAAKVVSMLRFEMGDSVLLHTDTVRRIIAATVLVAILEE